MTQKTVEPEVRRREPATHPIEAFAGADMFQVFKRLRSKPEKRPETCGA